MAQWEQEVWEYTGGMLRSDEGAADGRPPIGQFHFMSLHVFRLKRGKAVGWDKVGEAQGVNFTVPFWGTDRQRQNSSIYTNFT